MTCGSQKQPRLKFYYSTDVFLLISNYHIYIQNSYATVFLSSNTWFIAKNECHLVSKMDENVLTPTIAIFEMWRGT